MPPRNTRNTPTRAHTRARRDWAPVFLEALAQLGTVKDACRAAAIDRSTAYRRRQADETFALRWADIETESTEQLEAEAYRRAVEGVPRRILYDGEGKEIGYERVYSDQLLMFLLRARKPTVYSDRHRLEHTGEGGGPVNVRGLDILGGRDPVELPAATRQKIVKLLAGERERRDPGAADLPD